MINHVNPNSSDLTIWDGRNFMRPFTRIRATLLSLPLVTITLVLLQSHTLWLFNTAMENCPFIDRFTPQKWGFSMAMLNYQRLFLMANQHLGALPMVGSGASSSRSWPQENVQASFRGTEGIFGKFFTADVGWHSGRRWRCFETKNRICVVQRTCGSEVFYTFPWQVWVIYIYNYIMIWWVCLEVISPPKKFGWFQKFQIR